MRSCSARDDYLSDKEKMQLLNVIERLYFAMNECGYSDEQIEKCQKYIQRERLFISELERANGFKKNFSVREISAINRDLLPVDELLAEGFSIN